MHRNFSLREIGFDEYNGLCEQFGIPPSKSPYSQKMEYQLSPLVVRTKKHAYRDWFHFHKGGDIWLLRHIHVNQRNFRFYKFEEVQGLDNSIHAISAIYAGN